MAVVDGREDEFAADLVEFGARTASWRATTTGGSSTPSATGGSRGAGRLMAG